MIECVDGVMRNENDYTQWLANLQWLAENEPEDLTEDEFTALQNEGLLY